LLYKKGHNHDTQTSPSIHANRRIPRRHEAIHPAIDRKQRIKACGKWGFLRRREDEIGGREMWLR